MAVIPESAPAPARGRRWIYVVAALLCVGAIAFLLLGGLRGNIVYFRTVSEAVQENDTGRLRLAGEVVPGSISETDDGVTFEVTDGNETVAVVHRGDPPDLFAEGAPVVAEGEWDDGFAAFQSDRILINHGNEYSPPDVSSEDPSAEHPS
ncbi:MAG: cytochrome c maturation protein CcmE [Acidimicrobiia bacterium]|nr:cytochrome c maturation protein CcmE [Acidimicrobiia bacterium]